ncbi:MAG: SpoIIE family protein phosphatase [Candidatus Latescibacterota bacterium]|nr:MAG: SpoIIE family protein phosphatase [Candidatus Latescibacterota bacterium]
MRTLPDLRHLARAMARAAWRTRMFRFTLVVVVIAALIREPLLLLIPAILYSVRLLQAVIDRILDSVRARLAAFYLYVALLPTLLVLCILLFMGYVVLGHVSAQVIERRLESLAHWAERRAGVAEARFWAARAAGVGGREAAQQALSAAFAGVDPAAVVWWGIDPAEERVVTSHGRIDRARPLVPVWLQGRSFAGIVLRERRLELRMHRPLGGTALALGAVVPLDAETLNRGLPMTQSLVHGGLGAAGRRPGGTLERADSLAAESGVLAWYDPGVAAEGWPPRGALERQDVERAVAAGTRWATLQWDYRGHPVDWGSGLTHGVGPQILIVFSVEGGVRALLRTSFETVGVMGIVVAAACAVILLLQLVATIRGFLHARSISSSVAQLDRGVRAVRQGRFDYRIRPRARDQLGRLASAFDDMSEQLQTLLQERSAHEAVERELSIAREVQRRLFPERVPELPYVDVSGVCLPARSVSGDYYDFIPVQDGCDFVVADVSGKGISAALLMASLQAALRSQYTIDGGAPADPGETVTRLNRHLHAHVEPTRFVTLLLVRLLRDGRIVYCNAGHNPAARVREGRVEWMREGGLILGPFSDQRYEGCSLQARAGDVFCLYTDGVTEALGERGEQYGEARLATLLRRHADEPPRDLQETIVRDVRSWQAGGGEPSDDITLVVLRLKEPLS